MLLPNNRLQRSVNLLVKSICVIKAELPHGRMTKALASSHPTVVENKSLYISTRFPAGSAGQKETNSSPMNSRSMVKVAPKRKLSRLLANGPHRLRLRAAAAFPHYSLFVSWSLSLVLSSPAGFPVLSSRFTSLQVSLLSPPTHSTNPQPYGINGQPKKVHYIYSPFSVVGPVLWPHSDYFGTSQPKHRSKPRSGLLLYSTAEHSAGCCRLQVQEPLTLC